MSIPKTLCGQLAHRSRTERRALQAPSQGPADTRSNAPIERKARRLGPSHRLRRPQSDVGLIELDRNLRVERELGAVGRPEPRNDLDPSAMGRECRRALTFPPDISNRPARRPLLVRARPMSEREESAQNASSEGVLRRRVSPRGPPHPPRVAAMRRRVDALSRATPRLRAGASLTAIGSSEGSP